MGAMKEAYMFERDLLLRKQLNMHLMQNSIKKKAETSFHKQSCSTDVFKKGRVYKSNWSNCKSARCLSVFSSLHPKKTTSNFLPK